MSASAQGTPTTIFVIKQYYNATKDVITLQDPVDKLSNEYLFDKIVSLFENNILFNSCDERVYSMAIDK